MNLVSVLDEVIVLHAGIATALLKEFPGAHGVSFIVDRERLGGYPTADVPAGFAEGYSDAKFEARAAELVASITPRLKEVMYQFESLSITPRDFVVKAVRPKLVGDEHPAMKQSLRLMAAITGGLGSMFVRRSSLAVGDRVFVDQQAELHAVGVIDNPSPVGGAKAAAERGAKDYLAYLGEHKLLLANDYVPTETLQKWIDHFPEISASDFEQSYPVCRLISKTEEGFLKVYYPAGTATQDDLDLGIVEYDPTEGLGAVDPVSPVLPTSLRQ